MAGCVRFFHAKIIPTFVAFALQHMQRNNLNMQSRIYSVFIFFITDVMGVRATEPPIIFESET